MNDTELSKLASEFFRLFSRAEYALKMAGYHNGNGDAHANWRDFALSVEELIESPPTKELSEAIGSILAAPPKKQVIHNGQLQWAPSRPSTDSLADEVLLYVRRVRNNLFHGGKFNEQWLAPERSGPLMLYSITILSACIAANKDVQAAYKTPSKLIIASV